MRPTFRLAGYVGDGDNTAEALGAFLTRNAKRDVDVLVNSPGGAALEGAALLAEAEAHGRVRFIVRGVAASSASLMLCGGATVLMHPQAIWMAHLPTAVTAGDAEEHRRVASLLEKIGRTDAEAYARFSGQTLSRIRAWLAEELWLSAEEAVALGFADGLEEAAEPERPARHDYTRHAAAPGALQRLARENGWAAASPGPTTEEAQNA